MPSELITAIRQHQSAFGLELSDDALAGLERYYALVQEHNPLLHLVGRCSAVEFAVRHVLESLTMLEFLPRGASFADVGSGAGLPAIPCLIARDDLRGFLIESKEKKAEFLRTAIAESGRASRAEVIAKQFAETPSPDVRYVSCRALDKFAQHLPKLTKWARGRTLLFFGGPALSEEMRNLGLTVRHERLMPMAARPSLGVGR